jgi:hypothetical protein
VTAVRRVLPGVLKALGQRAELVERGRRATSDLFAGIIKRYSFASKDVDPAVARFAERMIENTPIDVVAEFYPGFSKHDKLVALDHFAQLPVLVLAGDDDLVTPSEHSEAIADRLPGAELVLVPDAGHLVMLERAEAVTDRLADLLARVGAGQPATTVDGYGPTSRTSRTSRTDQPAGPGRTGSRPASRPSTDGSKASTDGKGSAPGAGGAGRTGGPGDPEGSGGPRSVG